MSTDAILFSFGVWPARSVVRLTILTAT